MARVASASPHPVLAESPVSVARQTNNTRTARELNSFLSVHTFFNVVPSISRILHRQTFLARLELPPTHRNFPHTALLHAICAVTARYTAAVHTISVEETVRRTNEEIRGNIRRPQGMSADEEAATQECFGDRHARFTLLEMQIGHVTGRRMLEIAQAQVILAVYYQQHGGCLIKSKVADAYASIQRAG